MRLAGKVAIVTGGAMGIGEASATLFAREGAKVVIADRSERGNEVVAAIRQAGGEAIFVPTDVTQEADVQRVVQQAVATYGRLDVMFNNAGIGDAASVVDTTVELFQRITSVNLLGVLLGCRFAIPEMIKGGGGSIINTASVQGLLGFPGFAAYAASKAGVIGLTRQVAAEYARQQIRCNAICPGTIRTPMLDYVLERAEDPEGLLKSWAAIHPIGRFGLPGDIANAALFLASDESSFMTGQILVMDGGMTASGA